MREILEAEFGGYLRSVKQMFETNAKAISEDILDL